MQGIQAGATVVSEVPPPAIRLMDKIHAGVQLEILEAQKLTMGSRAIVVAFAGMKECGKTSLLARLHQQFQNGPLGEYDFAGSRTLLRFEEINWLATLESGVQSPEMERSSRQFDNTFLHLKIKKSGANGAFVDVLLNDISGETFLEAIAAEGVCEELFCLRRADHLVLLVDGASLASRKLRHDHCAKVRNFVQRVLQTGQIGMQTILHLVISKEDALRTCPNPEENREAANNLASDFSRLFGDKVAKIYIWQIAARPQDGSLPTEEVIAKIFGTWICVTRPLTNFLPKGYSPTRPKRDLSTFGWGYQKS